MAKRISLKFQFLMELFPILSKVKKLLEINPSTIYRKLQSWRAEGLLPTG